MVARNISWLVVGLLFLLLGCNGENGTHFVASGIVEGTAVKVAAQTGGLILQMNFDEGQHIDAGEVVAVIDTEKLAYRLEQTEANLEGLELQQKITANTLASARTDFENIEKKYQRFQELYKKKSASEQTLDDLRTAYSAARTRVENAQQNLKVLESKKKALEAEKKLLQRQIRDATVVAPLSGTITTKYYEAGETIPTGFALIEIIDLQKMWTKVYVSEKVLPRVKVGQPAEIRIDGTDRTLTGVVSWISPKAEFTPKNILTQENRTALVYAVKINVENRDGLLKHGMPVEVSLALTQP
ncbi:MAG: efflux RND transporter periplasmic adaptor subunit [Calditrichaeota bacterium]|nr:MAG: efflux RND transporter periplasmic adaptor subunit [Calditrichota bacterium]